MGQANTFTLPKAPGTVTSPREQRQILPCWINILTQGQYSHSSSLLAAAGDEAVAGLTAPGNTDGHLELNSLQNLTESNLIYI